MTIALITLGVVVVFLCWDRHKLVSQHERERADLLNRIKPESAQPLPGLNLGEAVPAVELEGPKADEDYWDAREKAGRG